MLEETRNMKITKCGRAKTTTNAVSKLQKKI